MLVLLLFVMLPLFAATGGLTPATDGPRIVERSEESVAAEARIHDALSAALSGLSAGGQNLKIEVVSSSHLDSAEGRFEFPEKQRASSSDPDVPLLWQGRFIPITGVSVPIWVKARVGVERMVVRAKETLVAGSPIRPESLEVVLQRVSPFSAELPQDPNLLVGRKLKRLVPAGTVIQAKWIETPKLIERRAMVNVEVVCGTARLRLHARSESAANSGERISVKNLKTGRLFAGVVRSDGSVLVEIPAHPAGGQRVSQ